uniref:PIR Superfamily Protein n=1 Tax=Globodera pallida TaxID=36090 RepID=A0A183C7K4_GLOPA
MFEHINFYNIYYDFNNACHKFNLLYLIIYDSYDVHSQLNTYYFYNNRMRRDDELFSHKFYQFGIFYRIHDINKSTGTTKSHDLLEHEYKMLLKHYYQLKINMTKLEIQYLKLKRECDYHMKNCPCQKTTSTATSATMASTTEQCDDDTTTTQPCNDDIPLVKLS